MYVCIFVSGSRVWIKCSTQRAQVYLNLVHIYWLTNVFRELPALQSQNVGSFARGIQ